MLVCVPAEYINTPYWKVQSLKRMRIGVLEWASCGGSSGAAALSDSIRVEGWAMCRAALLSLARAGHHAVAVVDPRCAADPTVAGRCDLQLHLDELAVGQPVWDQWQRVYADCDYTLCIAPECDGILERLLDWCQHRSIRTCNCASLLVQLASDKLRTAELLQSQNIPHPPTQLLADADSLWASGTRPLGDGQDSSGEPTWVIKPRDGVGCDATLRVTESQLRRSGGFASYAAQLARTDLSQLDLRGWVVQPWLSGQACSRSAIVDCSGRLHWLPVTRQHISIGQRVSYQGGSVEPELASQIPGLEPLLTQVVQTLASHPLGGQALGWLGIDFLYNPDDGRQPTTIIEINPRLTTSFVGLLAAGAPDLAALIVAAVEGQTVELPSQWQNIHFSAAGATAPTSTS